jgi:hypothetical protein
VAGIGIDPAVGFAPLHTHDVSGVIHVESPTVRTYTLGQFLGCGSPRAALVATAPPATGGCGSTSTVRPTRADPTTMPLASHQELVVAFGTAAQLPSPIPSAYRFPPGL